MPYAGIQEMRSTSCISPRAGSKRRRIHSDQKKVTNAEPSATTKSSEVILRGMKSSPRAPSVGRKTSRVKSPIMSSPVQVIGKERQCPGQKTQKIVLYVAGLKLAPEKAAAPHPVGDPVDDGVDHLEV